MASNYERLLRARKRQETDQSGENKGGSRLKRLNRTKTAAGKWADNVADRVGRTLTGVTNENFINPSGINRNTRGVGNRIMVTRKTEKHPSRSSGGRYFGTYGGRQSTRYNETRKTAQKTRFKRQGVA